MTHSLSDRLAMKAAEYAPHIIAGAAILAISAAVSVLMWKAYFPAQDALAQWSVKHG